MTSAFAAIALQVVMSVPISNPTSMSGAYERAAVAAPSVAAVASGSPSIAQTQLAGGKEAPQTNETITVRRGASISHQQVPKK